MYTYGLTTDANFGVYLLFYRYNLLVIRIIVHILL